ncbi:MAG: class I tRNA ligase family protein, partial [Planctomycetes bacterium]|nr:class I tRNA ligase family protein [Planctomycetota bacterium]
NPAGHRVSVPEPQCPNCSRKMVSAYGISSGLASPTDDTPLALNTSQRFDLGRNFANKLWNAARFALGQMNGETSDEVRLDELSLVDRWILARLYHIVRKIEAALAEYQFNVYADAMYEFIWGDFCDWYLEAIKPTVSESPAQQQVLRTVLNAILRILHPICPFVTESLWPHVQATGDASLEGICLAPSELLAEAAWPEIDAAMDDVHALADFSSLQALVESIRNIRGAHNVPPKKDIRLFATPTTIALIDRADRTVSALAGLSSVQTIDHRPADALVFTFDGEEQALADVIEKVDPEMERDRLQRQITDLQKRREGLVNRLANPGYTDKAPAHLVNETRTQLATVEADLGAAEKAIEAL